MEEGRGRQPLVSTGRGGAGNLLRSPSRGVDPEVRVGDERGREVRRDMSVERVIHSGRGGAGNIRSPSRDTRDRGTEDREDALQARLIAEERGRAHGGISTGRGGVGNIAGRDKSRSRSAVRDVADTDSTTPGRKGGASEVHASGRGGWGNINEERDSLDEEKLAAQEKHDAEIRSKHQADEVGKRIASGRGGGGNISAASPRPSDQTKEQQEEQAAHAKVHAQDKLRGVNTGRGGAGNIHREANGDHERGRNKVNGGGGGGGSVLGNVFRSLSRAARGDRGNERSSERAKD
ncbi:hypothetical protein BD324DRAFT_189002 [Kockovaella imperatae]|uniref:Uncharacterized protein n=1 Tax=Kockovaella imperatae TaxID=4999 RepID=A0A1Y1U914_9TREE|nr:hypothetical protein BD324DRAFT_189002 [Kockovaella imperatae]ORX33996.1 hypothetical protein BD324DRAFT_189002 [Kockovaella imperatae]